jgi:dihydrofolate reductase
MVKSFFTREGSFKQDQKIQGDLAGGVRQLKSEDGKEIVAHGGAGFAQGLVATGLVDEYRLLVHPVLLGKGLPLFSKLTQRIDLRLVEIKTFPAGSAAHIYRPV